MGPHLNQSIPPPSLPGGAREGETGEPTDERLALVLRISSGPQFRRAAKLREFLAYVVNRTLLDPDDSLNEQQIGRAVFGRAADYSPSDDNVVRAHARQLRVKLGEYFSSTGKNEPLILEIPKGSYAPVFSQRPSVPVVPVVESSGRWQPPRLSGILVVSSVLAVLIGSLGMSVFLSVQNRALRRQVATSVGATVGTVPAPLAWVFDPDRSASLVVADSCFGLMQDLTGRPASLEEYLTPQFWQSVKPSSSTSSDGDRLMRRIRSRELTSYADVLLATRILRLADPRAKISIRFARDLHPRDLNSGNFVFLGSSYANPWVALYDRKRNFRIQVDANSRQSIVNKTPRPGERASYLMLGEDGVPGVTYGLIAYFPSDGVTGNVLILEGTNMEGTEAAGSMIVDPKAARDVLTLAGIPERSRSHPFFEILVETKVLAGEPSQTRVVAWRK